MSAQTLTSVAMDDHIVRLEEKVMFLDRQVSDLDEVVRDLGDELRAARRDIEGLVEIVRRMRDRPEPEEDAKDGGAEEGLARPG